MHRFQIFSPARYFTFPEDDLKKAVLLDNRVLCKGCEFDSFQKCKIRDAQLISKMTDSEVNLHRVTCLAIAAGILKQRTGIDIKTYYITLLHSSNNKE